MTPKQLAKYTLKITKKHLPRKRNKVDIIVNAIEFDICDRKGLNHEWGRIDPQIAKEIKLTWKYIIQEGLK